MRKNMNKFIVVAVVAVIIGSVGILFVPDILNQNTVSNVLQVEDAYWLGEDGLFYFEIYNPTNRFIDGVTFHGDFIGYENVYGNSSSDSHDQLLRAEKNFSPTESITFTTRNNCCYFEKVKLTATVGTEYILEKTVNIEQRGEGYAGLSWDNVRYIITDNNTTLKTIINLRNSGTANAIIAEVNKSENFTCTPFPNNLIPVREHAVITIYQKNIEGYNYDKDSTIRRSYEIVTSEGETLKFSQSGGHISFE